MDYHLAGLSAEQAATYPRPGNAARDGLMKIKRLLLVGYGRAGKDCGLEMLSTMTGLRNAGCTSLYLAKYVARELDIGEMEAFQTRHEHRNEWYRIGNELRRDDPGILLREALANGELTGGVRDREEVVTARQDGLVDLIIWIQNDRVPVDPTVKFGPEHCDLIVQNNGTLDEYCERLRRLAAFAGMV